MNLRRTSLRIIISLTLVSAISSTILIAPSDAVVTCAAGGTCAYGDTGPGGGKVFIIPSTAGNSTGKYFELAPASTEAATPWCGNGTGTHNTNTLVGTSTAIGTGKANTDAIIAFCGGASAADSATAYRGGGFSDWFLPSKDELNAEYWNLKVDGLDTFNAGDTYVSSSESTTSTVWMQDINEIYGPRATSSDFQKDFTKNSGSWYPIFNRPVRMFNAGDGSNSNSSSNNNEAALKEAERLRQEKIRNAQLEILRKITAHTEVLKADLAAAEATLIGEPLLAKANSEFSTLDSSTAIDFSKVSKVISKYAVYERISGNISGATYPQDLVTYELLRKETPLKCLITRNLLALPVEERDTFEEINAYLAKENAAQLARKERLAAIVAKIHSR